MSGLYYSFLPKGVEDESLLYENLFAIYNIDTLLQLTDTLTSQVEDRMFNVQC
jgi:hypothetical protein